MGCEGPNLSLVVSCDGVQVRRSRSIAIPVNKDSLYKPIERQTRHFNPLALPKSLQASTHPTYVLGCWHRNTLLYSPFDSSF